MAEKSSDSAQYLNAVQQAMERKGTLNHPIVQGVYLGHARSGKSSLIKRLTGEGPPSSSPSTGVAEVPVHIQVIWKKSYSVPLCVTDSVWFKLTYNKEAIDLMSRIFHSLSQPNSASPPTHASLEVQGLQLPHLPEGFKHPIEIMKSAASGEDVSQHLDNSWSLYLTDTGGQLEFQELLPLVVSGPSVFFITFRLDKDLNEVFEIQYELPNGTTFQLYKSTLTMLEAMLQSLASISSMGTFTYDGLQRKDIPLRPKVFIVGTHKDKLEDKLDPVSYSLKVREIDQYLQKKITSTSHYRDGLVQFATADQLIFTVNNLSQDDSDFQTIRSAVEDLVRRGEFEMNTPSHWLILSLVIRTLTGPVINFDQCLSVAQHCGILDKDELKHALHFLHTKLGVVRYFPDGGLGDIVVINPQFLFDKVTNLIVQTFTFKKAGKKTADDFSKKGIFLMSDFERVSSDFDPPLTCRKFVSLLQHLRIVAQFKTKGGETKYFIPCVLARAKDPDVMSMSQQVQVPPLVVTFECGYCPKGLAGALIVYLQSNEMKSELEWQLQPDKIFRNQVSFYVGPDEDIITLNIFPTSITITFVPLDQSSVRANNIGDVCTEVRKSIELGIETVAEDMNYLLNSKHKITFNCYCDDCCNDPSPAELKWHKGKPFKLRCKRPSNAAKPVRLILTPNHYLWFQFQGEKQVQLGLRQLNTVDHYTKIITFLNDNAYVWRDIGLNLGFSPDVLKNIESKPVLLTQAPHSYLQEMIHQWLQWAPGDRRGSKNFATFEDLRNALLQVDGMAAKANDLEKALFG